MDEQRRPVAIWLRLARVFHKVDHASIEQMRGWDLSLAQFDVLARVGASEGITQQQLADRLLVTKGNICQLLDRMEARGLLERRQEGRANRIFLTEAGQTLWHQAVPAHEALIGELMGALSPGEQAELLPLVRKLDHALN
ncbi:MAG TPA: MarR family transcriptional regulator [Ktedonobacterales bacterium]|nr:MarR family transcriptional regulator [Ktedonobacterales bacterium]